VRKTNRPDYYSHVGSRETPDAVCIQMMRFARLQRRYPRSGGAKGADESAEASRHLITYLPWINFRNKPGIGQYTSTELYFADTVLQRAFPPGISRLTRTTKAFFRRNVFQVMGQVNSVKESRSKGLVSDFVLCWTPRGEESIEEYELGVTGGTGIAINVASIMGVPVYNLQREKRMRRMQRWCKHREAALGLVFDATTGLHYYKGTRKLYVQK